jgi:hypothetical protein
MPTPDELPGSLLPDVGSVGRMLSDESPEHPASAKPVTSKATARRLLMADAPANRKARARIIAQV